MAADGNGSGLTQRELLMELRDDVKDIKQTLTEKADAQHMWTMEDRITRLESNAIRRDGPVAKEMRDIALDVRELKRLRREDVNRWRNRSYFAPWISNLISIFAIGIAIWIAAHP